MKIFFVTLEIGEFLRQNFLRLDWIFGPGSANDERFYNLLPYCFACIGKRQFLRNFRYSVLHFNEKYKTIPSLYAIHFGI